MRARTFGSAFFSLALIAALVVGIYTFFKDLDGPKIEVSPNTGRVSPATTLKIHMSDPSGIRALTVGIRKNNVSNTFFEKHFDEYSAERDVDVSLKDVPSREGSFELEVRATDASLAGFGQGNTHTMLLPMRFDVRPPHISIKTLPPNVRRGGTGMVRYTIDEETSTNGILIRDFFVPGYLQKDGSFICFFPFPYSMTAREFKSEIRITATDLAGNVTKTGLTVMAFERKFKEDKLDISDSFLESVQNKLNHLAPNAASPLDCYLYINNTVRSENSKELFEIGKDTASAMLWNGPFVRLPRSAPRAGFADHRFLFYQGKQVGESFHLGYDFASVRNAEIPAANSGRVVYTGEMGIYGNLIVIDHGLGLMSLYSHLSETLVGKGDMVTKGQVIARTGSTGLAFGDHLHFGILVAGVEVTPLEWIDPKWIRDNIIGRLENPRNS